MDEQAGYAFAMLFMLLPMRLDMHVISYAFRDIRIWLVRLSKYAMRTDFDYILFRQYYHTRALETAGIF